MQGTEDAEIILPIEKQSKETLEPVISEQRFFAYAKNEDIVQEIQNEIHIIPENYQNTIEMSIKN